MFLAITSQKALALSFKSLRITMFKTSKMKLNAYFPLLLLVLLSGTAKLMPGAMAFHGGHAARIPEHTCHKQLVNSGKCELQRCIKGCYKESYGVGKCKGLICSCTFFCKQPPLM